MRRFENSFPSVPLKDVEGVKKSDQSFGERMGLRREERITPQN